MEVLVVVSIIVALGSIVFKIVGDKPGPSLKISGDTLKGTIQAARSQALLKRTSVRLIIHNDKSDAQKYCRFMGVVYYHNADPSNPQDRSGWKAATQGVYLSEGIYFDPKLSDTRSADAWSQISKTMQIDFPRSIAQEDGGGRENYFFYEINKDGSMQSANSWLVYRAGSLVPSGGGNYELRIEEAQKFVISALIFRYVGAVVPVEDPDAILF